MLVGRATELAALRERIAARSAVVVLGEAGIGKTELLRVAGEAEAEHVFEGGGLATLRWIPYLPLARALRTDLAGDETAVTDEVAASVGDGLLIVDDLHWADAETLRVLPLLPGRVRVAAAARTGDPDTGRAVAAAESAGFEVLQLEPLTRADAEAVAATANPRLSAEEISEVCARAGGNPLLLNELATGPSAALEAAFPARVARLSGAGREACRRLALLGRPAPRKLLGRGASELFAAGVAVEQEGRLALPHELLAGAVADTMNAEERRSTHVLLAQLVDEAGEAARHHFAAGEAAEAYARALEAASAARTPAERARHLELAAACAPPTEADDLRLAAADAFVAAGEYEAVDEVVDPVTTDDPFVRAAVHLHRARARGGLSDWSGFRDELTAGLALAAGTGSAVEVRLRVEEAWNAGWMYEPGHALELAREVLRLAQEKGIERARALTVLARLEAFNCDAPRAVRDGRAAAELARAEGDARTEIEALQGIAMAHEFVGNPAAGLEVVRETRLRAQELRLNSLDAMMWEHELHFRLLLEGPSLELAEEIEALLARPGLGSGRDHGVGEYAQILGDLGRFEEARAVIAAALASDLTEYGREVVLVAGAHVEWLADEPERALAMSEEHVYSHVAGGWLAPLRAWALVDLGRDVPPFPQGLAYYAGAETTTRALSLLGKPGYELEAEELLLVAADEWREYSQSLRCRWGAAEAARLAGEQERVRERLLELEPILERSGMVALLRRVRRSLARVGVVRRDVPEARRTALSPREREVLRLIATGLTSAAIAEELGVARATVDAHVRSAMQKLSARSRVHAAVLAGEAE